MIESFISFIVFIFSIVVFFLPIIWLISLQVKYNQLSEKYDLLKEDIDSFQFILDSIKYELKNIKREIIQTNNQNINKEETTENESTTIIEHYKDIVKEDSVDEKAENVINEKPKEIIKEDIIEEHIDNSKAVIDEKQDKLEDSVTNISSSKDENIEELQSSNIVEKPALEEENDSSDNMVYENVEVVPTQPKEPISFVQLFSWIGGFILLLGVVFLIKYALENNLLSPGFRVAIGTLAGLAMWGVGLWLKKPEVKTTSDTLCACGLTTCYSIWFAAYYFYGLTSQTITFVLLTIISFVSFGTAVWKNAQYIGVLAQIIGFLTPALFSSEKPQIWFLLLYLAIINVTAISAALKRNWSNQLYTGLFFTFISFISVIRNGDIVQLTVYPSIFATLYTIIAITLNKKELLKLSYTFTFISLFILGIQLFYYDNLSSLPYIISFSAVFAVIFGIISYVKKDEQMFLCSLAFTIASFIIIATSKSFITLFIFISVLSLFFGFISVKLQNKKLLLGTLGLTLFGFVTLYITNDYIIEVTYLPYLTAFMVFFGAFFGYISYKQKHETLLLQTIIMTFFSFCFLLTLKDERYLVPLVIVFSFYFGILSFKMKNVMLVHSSIIFTFICNILLCVLCLFDQKLHVHPFLITLLLESILYYVFAVKEKRGSYYALTTFFAMIPFFFLSIFDYKNMEHMLELTLCWNILVLLVPFVFKKSLENSKTAWGAVSCANIFAGFLILCILYNLKYDDYNSLGFISWGISLMYAAYTYQVIDWYSIEENENQKNRVTGLINAPIIFLILGTSFLFENESKTIMFSLEGLGLVWLWHKLKIDLIQKYGLLLLLVVNFRLLFNPYIVDYYEKTYVIFNWYLYTYLIAAISMIGSSIFWKKSEFKFVPNLLMFLGGILIFALINIEIANYYCNGVGLKFNICGEFSEAATYTIVWAICGAICMFVANKKVPYLLQTGIGLISLVLLKLFLSDIWSLSSGLRIVVLIGVAVIMLAISFIYQKFHKKIDIDNKTKD